MKKIFLSMGLLLVIAGSTAGSVKIAGKVGNVDPVKKEIIVNVNSGIDLNIGELLEIDTVDGGITIEVTYPMLTVARCKIKGKGRLSSITKNIPVYFYGKSPEKETPAADRMIEQRFSDNASGIIKDNKTGLIWLKDANYTRKSMTWDDAQIFLEKLDAAGYADWRLPTKEEFEGILKIGPDELKKTFDNLRIYYWTSTKYTLEEGFVWVASVEDGNVNYSFRTNDNYIWPVRDGKPRVRNSGRISGVDENIKKMAEETCQKNNEEFVSYSKKDSSVVNTTYGVVCRKGKRESARSLVYNKITGSWSD